jgi:RHS repeat-associated protein
MKKPFISTAGSLLSEFHFDALDRKTFDGYGTGPNWSRSVGYTFDLGDRLTQAVDSTSGPYTRVWDGNNRLKTETTPNGTVTYCYDHDGRRTGMSFNGSDACTAPQTTYVYNADNDVTSISQTGFGTTSYVYDQHRQQCSLTLPNGVSQSYSYDQDLRLTVIAYANGSTNLGNMTYGYDAAGRRTQVSGGFASTVLPGSYQTGPLTYRNNNTVQYAFSGRNCFGADRAGNNVSKSTDSACANTYQSNTFDVRSQLNSISAILAGESISMLNDPFNRRQRRAISGCTGCGSTTTYLYDGTNVLVEQVQGVGNATVMLGLRMDEHLARTSSTGVTRYFLTDAQGSTIALTDASGTIQTLYTYGPFGLPATSGQKSDNPYQFVGRELDLSSSAVVAAYAIYNFRARYYDATVGRFFSSDPEGFAGGSRNLYAYASNNPLNLLDPTGKFSLGLGYSAFGSFTSTQLAQGGGYGVVAAAGGAPTTGSDAAGASSSGTSGTGGPGSEQVASTNGQGYGTGTGDDPYAVSQGQTLAVTAEPRSHVYGVDSANPNFNVDVYCDALGRARVNGVLQFSSVVSVNTFFGGTLTVICNSPAGPSSSGY